MSNLKILVWTRRLMAIAFCITIANFAPALVCFLMGALVGGLVAVSESIAEERNG